MAETTHDIQARAEGVDIVGDGRKVTLLGAEFRMADRIGLMPLMRFAQSAKTGMDADDMEGLAAMYTLIRDCIDTHRPQRPVLDEHGQPLIRDGAPVTEDDGRSEWDRFEDHAIATKADADDLMKVVQDVIEALTARPSQRPADSSAGPQITSAPSKVTSSSPERSATVLAFRNAPDPAEVAELVSIDEIVKGRSGPVRLTG